MVWEKVSLKYNLEDLFQSINDIFYEYDEGHVTAKEAEKMAQNCCEAFLEDTNKRDDIKTHLMLSLAFGRGLIDSEQLKQLLIIYKEEL